MWQMLFKGLTCKYYAETLVCGVCIWENVLLAECLDVVQMCVCVRGTSSVFINLSVEKSMLVQFLPNESI